MMDTNKYKTYDYGINDPETGSWCTVYELDKALRAIKIRNMRDQDKIRYLESENKKLKEKIYKDEELAKMKTQLEAMQKDYYRGFPISEEDQKHIEEWQKKHEAEAHHCHTLDERLRRSGAIGGSYTYEFIPTSIGTVGKIKCSCGATFTFSELM